MNKTVLIDVDMDGSYKYKLQEAFKKVDKTIVKYNSDGYKVVSMLPLIAGDYEINEEENKSYGYGYSFTSGIIIVFEEIEHV